MHFVYLFDSSSSKPENPLMDFRYRSRFGMRVIGKCVSVMKMLNIHLIRSLPGNNCSEGFTALIVIDID